MVAHFGPRVAHSTALEFQVSGSSSWNKTTAAYKTSLPPESKLTTYVLRGLEPGSTYQVRALNKASKVLGTATFKTLPQVLSRSTWTEIFLGSCIGRTDKTVTRDLNRTALSPTILNLFVGDQVYLDMDPLVVPRPTNESMQIEFAHKYRKFLRAAQPRLSASASVFLPDDHEFWNNFPHTPSIFAWPGLNSKKVQAQWTRMALRYLSAYQGVRPTRTFNVGGVSFFAIDLRSNRTHVKNARPRLTSPNNLAKLRSWCSKLKGPGVLVMNQPLIDEAGGGNDSNLPAYNRDYLKITKALSYSTHDIVILTGDKHWARIAMTRLRTSNRRFHPRLVEITSSPVKLVKLGSKRSSYDGIRPTRWPRIAGIPSPHGDEIVERVYGIKPHRVEYMHGGHGINNYAIVRFRAGARPGHVELEVSIRRTETGRQFMYLGGRFGKLK